MRTGYSVTLPGLTSQDGESRGWAGGTLGAGLTLGQLRARWRSGLQGAAPPGLYDGADADAVWEHSVGVARAAAAEMQAGRVGPDVALAAADVLTVAADVTGSADLRRAAESFGRAARIPGGRRSPLPDPVSRALRTSARLMASSRPPSRYRAGRASPASGLPVLLLVIAIVVIAATLAVLRFGQRREDQARPALDAAVRLVADAGARIPPALDTLSFPGQRHAGQQPAVRSPERRPRSAHSPRPGPRP